MTSIKQTRRSIKVEWKGQDGSVFTTETEINGTEEEIRAYYIGKTFNIGRGGDDWMAVAQSVTFTN